MSSSPVRPRTPLGTLTNSPAVRPPSASFKLPSSSSKGMLTCGRTPVALTKLSAAAPYSRPKAPSTPGSMDSTNESEFIGDGIDLCSSPSIEPSPIGDLPKRRGAVHVPHDSRYSVGGTALHGYEGFRSCVVDVDVNTACTQAAVPSASASSFASSATSLIPPSTRALMLEERLKEAEQRCKSLQEQNAALRRHAAAAQQQHQLSLASSTVEGGTQTDDRHPAFGRLVADLGFKKIFVASARTFVSSVPIWSKQRPCNEGRVSEIVNAKARHPSFMGPIMCFEFTSAQGASSHAANSRSLLTMPSLTCPQPVGIFDGQHRARAAMRLLASDDFSISDDENAPPCPSPDANVADPANAAVGGRHADFDLVVEVYPVRNEAQVKALYLEVNKGEMVKEIDLPDALAPELKAHIDGAVEQLVRRWTSMFKPSERCRPPHLHRDTLRNRLFQAPAAHGVGSADELVAMVMRANEGLKARSRSSWPERVRGKVLDKARATGCFLGLAGYEAWIDSIGS